jgi:hypothetical protein
MHKILSTNALTSSETSAAADGLLVDRSSILTTITSLSETADFGTLTVLSGIAALDPTELFGFHSGGFEVSTIRRVRQPALALALVDDALGKVDIEADLNTSLVGF